MITWQTNWYWRIVDHVIEVIQLHNNKLVSFKDYAILGDSIKYHREFKGATIGHAALGYFVEFKILSKLH